MYFKEQLPPKVDVLKLLEMADDRVVYGAVV